MARNATDIIWQAEDAVVVYLRTALMQSQTHGYVGEIPPVMPAPDSLGHWEFDISGGVEWTQHTAPTSVPPPSVTLGAQFRGIFKSRKAAQRLCGLLLNALPIGRDIVDGVIRLQFETPFTIGREEFTVEPTTDGEESGTRDMWVLVWPMKLVLEVPDDGQ
jgi:hypothetical protein